MLVLPHSGTRRRAQPINPHHVSALIGHVARPGGTSQSDSSHSAVCCRRAVRLPPRGPPGLAQVCLFLLRSTVFRSYRAPQDFFPWTQTPAGQSPTDRLRLTSPSPPSSFIISHSGGAATDASGRQPRPPAPAPAYNPPQSRLPFPSPTPRRDTPSFPPPEDSYSPPRGRVPTSTGGNGGGGVPPRPA